MSANGIGALTFNCKHYAACAAASTTLVTAQESYVGPNYISPTHPRLLFLSLDSGSMNTDPHARTIEELRRVTVAGNVFQLPKGKHWYETHELAYGLLSRFDDTIRLGEVVRHFSHMNSAKCCQNNAGRTEASGRLFDNCRDYIWREIAIFRPDILVTQGAQARNAVADRFAVLHTAQFDVSETTCEYRVLRTTGEQETIWFPTHHPRAYGVYWAQKRACWQHFAKAAVTFLDRGPSSRA